MKRTAILLSLVFLNLCAIPVFAGEEKILLGREEQWISLLSREGLIQVVGKAGFQDLILADSEYSPDSDTDLLLHFNNEPVRDLAGNYSVQTSGISSNTPYARYGNGCGVFQANKGVVLVPGSDSLFAPQASWQDFTIEFWMYSSSLTEGESVFLWEGVSLDQQKFVPQRIEARIENRILVWRFENFFRSPDKSITSYELKSVGRTVPREWHHHMIRYRSARGLLEYCIDGIPAGVIYTTETRRESSQLFLPAIGNNDRNSVIIGKSFTGFMDELRISRTFVESPFLGRYQERAGRAITRVFDLKYSGTQIKRIIAQMEKPGDSEISFYYRVSDSFNTTERLREEWVPFVPGQLEQKNIRGRYLQILVEFYPDGRNSQTPRLYGLEIAYEPDLPPISPAGLVATPGNLRVILTWKPVLEDDVKGYMVFYGPAPLNYTGTDALQGASPIDVGRATTVEITGLKNGKLYYFTVVAYDGSSPPHLSEFSLERSARPSEVLR